uniref:Uncharacterized protein n=1 Tax=Arion vulgaris TaxID=1028688 RepID=A0A0B7BWA4_9EUPU
MWLFALWCGVAGPFFVAVYYMQEETMVLFFTTPGNHMASKTFVMKCSKFV